MEKGKICLKWRGKVAGQVGPLEGDGFVPFVPFADSAPEHLKFLHAFLDNEFEPGMLGKLKEGGVKWIAFPLEGCFRRGLGGVWSAFRSSGNPKEFFARLEKHYSAKGVLKPEKVDALVSSVDSRMKVRIFEVSEAMKSSGCAKELDSFIGDAKADSSFSLYCAFTCLPVDVMQIERGFFEKTGRSYFEFGWEDAIYRVFRRPRFERFIFAGNPSARSYVGLVFLEKSAMEEERILGLMSQDVLP